MRIALTTLLVLAAAGPAAAQTPPPAAPTPAQPATPAPTPGQPATPAPTAGQPAPAAPAPAAPAPADATPASVARATVLHVPVAEALPGAPVEITAVIDGAWAEPDLVARYRSRRDPDWHDAPFQKSSAGGWFATIPADAVLGPSTEYYIVGRNASGEVAHFASADAPQPIRVEPTLADHLEANDEARTAGRRNTLSLDVDGHDFGNRYGEDDAFLRAELHLTHRVSRSLYAIGFGFGSIWGRTPDGEGRAAGDMKTMGRYGTAEVRVRAHPSIFVDARLSLGVSHEGFMTGGGGAITFGRPWRSNLSFGADYLQDLGPTAYVRLQWDTAPPLLMGASIVRTELPGVVIAANGLYIKYDVAYTLDRRLTLKGAVSYGSRDGGGRFGGALGVAANF